MTAGSHIYTIHRFYAWRFAFPSEFSENLKLRIDTKDKPCMPFWPLYQLWRPGLCFELSLSISGKLPDILQCCVCTTLIAKCHHELSFGIPFGDYTTDPIEVQSHGILFQVVCNGMTSGFLKHVTMSNILANSFRLLCIHGWISGLNHNRAPTGLFCPLTLIPFGWITNVVMSNFHSSCSTSVD